MTDKRRQAIRDDPTQSELEVMIAEQLANKPAWWAASERAAAKYGTSGTGAGKLAKAIRTKPVRRRTGRRA